MMDPREFNGRVRAARAGATGYFAKRTMTPVMSLPCGCVWRGETLDRGCRQSERLREEMERLSRDDRARSQEWYSLAIRLEREHGPEPS